MSPEAVRWARIEEIFQGALDLPESARDAYLAAACGDDAALRGEVDSLLAHAPAARQDLDRVVENAIGEVQGADLPGVDAGTKLGPFELVREIGRGGMGTVYLAYRTGDEFRQSVAVKLVSRGMDSRAILGRFRNERRILAALEHPNIARLLDGGSTPDGRPYFVMEYVDGLPVTDYCRDRDLDVPARLRLFVDICGAVEHAHRRMVIHRDIKPANIMVLRGGIPKLLDFGIAKLLDQTDTPDMALTATNMRLLTPEYASPEQVRGEPVSAATDVYGLGAVLFELLTGRKAHAMSGNSQLELERAICLGDTRLPSEAVLEAQGPSAAKLARVLAGDLDNIVLMAMRKEQARRYQSAAELAADIERYLEGRPVAARKDTLAYRAAKFIRRNRTAVAAGVIVVLAVTGGVASSLYEARRAERRFSQVRKLANRFLFDFDGQIAYVPGTTKAREMLVKTALEYLDSLSSESGSDRALRAELAAAYESVADIQGRPAWPSLGKHQESLQSYRKSRTILESLAAAGPAEQEILISLTRVILKTARLEIALGDTAAAERSMDRALPFARRLPRMVNGQLKDYAPLTVATDQLAMLRLRKDPAAALKLSRENLDVWRRLVAATPTEKTSIGLAIALQRVGLASAETGDLTAARAAYTESVSIFEGLKRTAKGNVHIDKSLLAVAHEFGQFYQNWPAGPADLETARQLLSRAADLAKQRARTDPNDREARSDWIETALDHAAAVTGRDPRQARVLYQEAREAERDQNFAGTIWAAIPLHSDIAYAAVLAANGDLGGARRVLDPAARELEQLLSKSSAPDDNDVSSVIDANIELGTTLAGPDAGTALRHLETARQTAEKRGTATLTAVTYRAKAYEALERHFRKSDPDAAAQWRRRTADLWQEWLRSHPQEAWVTAQLKKPAALPVHQN